MAIDVVMWLLSIVLLICILATCAINIITSFEKQDKLKPQIADKVWEGKKETRIPTRKMALVSSITTIVVLIATIVVGACSSHGKEAFHAFLP